MILLFHISVSTTVIFPRSGSRLPTMARCLNNFSMKTPAIIWHVNDFNHMILGVHHVHRPWHAVPPVDGWHEGPLRVCPWTGAHHQVGTPQNFNYQIRRVKSDVEYTPPLVDWGPGRFGRLQAVIMLYWCLALKSKDCCMRTYHNK